MKSRYRTPISIGSLPTAALVAAVGIALICAAGCAEYNAPPEPRLVSSEDGAFEEGTALEIEFTEPIDPDTLELSVWPNKRDPEGEIRQSVQPMVEPCAPKDSPCGDLTMTLAEDAESVTVELQGDLGEPGRPLLLEVLPGLADPEGNETGINYLFGFQYRGRTQQNAEPVEFDDGIYIIGASVQNPLPAVLTLVSDLRVLEEGDFALAGASGKTYEDASKESIDPDDVYVNTTAKGWTVYATGFVTLQEDGTRLLETEPFDAFVPLGMFDLHLDQVRLYATIEEDESGHDSLDGTLSFEQIRLVNDDQEQVFEGDTTAMRGKFVPEDKRLEGSPDLCTDLCGGVVGHCEPPEDFPPAEFCE